MPAAGDASIVGLSWPACQHTHDVQRGRLTEAWPQGGCAANTLYLKQWFAMHLALCPPCAAFMARLGAHIRFFIRKKIAEDPAWQKPTIIFSGGRAGWGAGSALRAVVRVVQCAVM